MIKSNENIESEAMPALPKNIRQIGEVQNGQRIYIEDYAYTYLHQFALKFKNEEQIAFLIGKKFIEENENILLIYGTIQGMFLKRDNNNVEITEDTWLNLHEIKKKYFSQGEIVGWVYTQPGYGVLLTSSLIKQNEKFFNEEGQVLFILDPMEKEEMFFEVIENELVQKAGFFVYYEKNIDMHEYMLDYKLVQDNFSEIKIDDAVRHFRIKDQEKKEVIYHKKFVNMLFALSGALVIMCILIGVGLINNFEEMNRLKKSFGIVMEDYGSFKNELEDIETKEALNTKISDNITEEVNVDENKTIKEEYENNEENINENIKDVEEPVVEAIVIPKTYTVKPGDNLIKISYLFYSNKEKVADIQELNKIENPNKIYVGQILLLP